MIFVLALLKRLWSYAPARYALIALIAAGIGYGAALLSRPVKTITKTQVQTETKYVDRVVYKEAKERIVYRNVVRTVTVERQPDGETKTVTVIADHSTDKTDDHKDSATVVTGDTATKTLTQTVTVYSKPNWRVGALVGADFVPKSPYVSGPAYGAIVERRIAGPLNAGLWGLRTPTGGIAGISVSFDF